MTAAQKITATKTIAALTPLVDALNAQDAKLIALDSAKEQIVLAIDASPSRSVTSNGGMSVTDSELREHLKQIAAAETDRTALMGQIHDVLGTGRPLANESLTVLIAGARERAIEKALLYAENRNDAERAAGGDIDVWRFSKMLSHIGRTEGRSSNPLPAARSLIMLFSELIAAQPAAAADVKA